MSKDQSSGSGRHWRFHEIDQLLFFVRKVLPATKLEWEVTAKLFNKQNNKRNSDAMKNKFESLYQTPEYKIDDDDMVEELKDLWKEIAAKQKIARERKDGIIPKIYSEDAHVVIDDGMYDCFSYLERDITAFSRSEVFQPGTYPTTKTFTSKIGELMRNSFKDYPEISIDIPIDDTVIVKDLLKGIGWKPLSSQIKYIVMAARGIDRELLSRSEIGKYSFQFREKLLYFEQRRRPLLFKILDLPPGFGKTVLSLLTIVLQYYYRFRRGEIAGVVVENKQLNSLFSSPNLEQYDNQSYLTSNIVMIFSTNELATAVWLPFLKKVQSAVKSVLNIKVTITSRHPAAPLVLDEDPQCIQFVLQRRYQHAFSDANMQKWTSVGNGTVNSMLGKRKSASDETEAESNYEIEKNCEQSVLGKEADERDVSRTSQLIQSVDWVLLDDAHSFAGEANDFRQSSKVFHGAMIASGLMFIGTSGSLSTKLLEWAGKPGFLSANSPLGMAFPTIMEHMNIGDPVHCSFKFEMQSSNTGVQPFSMDNLAFPKYLIELRSSLLVNEAVIENLFHECEKVNQRVRLYRMFIRVVPPPFLSPQSALSSLLTDDFENQMLNMLSSSIGLTVDHLPVVDEDSEDGNENSVLMDTDKLMSIIHTHIADKRSEIDALHLQEEAANVSYKKFRLTKSIEANEAFISKSEQFAAKLHGIAGGSCRACKQTSSTLLIMKLCCGVFLCQSCALKGLNCHWCRPFDVSIPRLVSDDSEDDSDCDEYLSDSDSDNDIATIDQVLCRAMRSITSDDEQVHLNVVVTSIVRHFVALALRSQKTVYVLVTSTHETTAHLFSRLCNKKGLINYIYRQNSFDDGMETFYERGDFERNTGIVRFFHHTYNPGKDKALEELNNSIDAPNRPALNAVLCIDSAFNGSNSEQYMKSIEERITRLSRGFKGPRIPAAVYISMFDSA